MNNNQSPQSWCLLYVCNCIPLYKYRYFTLHLTTVTIDIAILLSAYLHELRFKWIKILTISYTMWPSTQDKTVFNIITNFWQTLYWKKVWCFFFSWSICLVLSWLTSETNHSLKSYNSILYNSLFNVRKHRVQMYYLRQHSYLSLPNNNNTKHIWPYSFFIYHRTVKKATQDFKMHSIHKFKQLNMKVLWRDWWFPRSLCKWRHNLSVTSMYIYLHSHISTCLSPRLTG